MTRPPELNQVAQVISMKKPSKVIPFQSPKARTKAESSIICEMSAGAQQHNGNHNVHSQ